MSVIPIPTAVAGRRPRVALYGHDTLGLGHMRRNLALAGTLAEDGDEGIGADVLLIGGSRDVGLFPSPEGVETLVLPGIRKGDDGVYRARSLRTPLEEVVDLRSVTLTSALTTFAPDILVVDKTPRGFGGELNDVLPVLRAAGTRLVLGLRDVLDDPGTTAREWRAERGDQAVRDLYDEVWVYGDDRVHDVVAACGMSPEAAAKTHHVGYLAEDRPTTDADHRPGSAPYVLVMVGGGQDGTSVVEAACQVEAPEGHDVVVLTGPQISEEDLAAARRQARDRGIRVMRFSRHASDWLRGASAAVTMGGSNTVAEILATDVPALVVPRVAPRLEQAVRAQALAARGVLDVLVPDQITPERLTRWIAQNHGRAVDRTHLRLDGLACVRRRAAELLAARRGHLRSIRHAHPRPRSIDTNGATGA